MRNFFKLLVVLVLGKFKPKKKEMKLRITSNIENLINELSNYEKSTNKRQNPSDSLDRLYYYKR